MVREILVHIYCPALDTGFDFRISEHVKVETVLKNAVNCITQVTDINVYAKTDTLLLCDDFGVLAPEKTLKVCGVSNGTKLYLV